MDAAVKQPKLKDALELPADGRQRLVGLAHLVGLVVLEDVDLDHEEPALARVGGVEGGLPVAEDSQGGAVARGREEVVAEEAEFDVIAEELVCFLDGFAF